MPSLVDHVRRFQRERFRLERVLLKTRGPLLKGSLFTQWVVCGNPRCKCAKGERHGPYVYLSRKVAGADPRYLGNRKELVKAAEAYRTYQGTLKQIVRCDRELEKLWVKLREQRIQSFPAGKRK